MKVSDKLRKIGGLVNRIENAISLRTNNVRRMPLEQLGGASLIEAERLHQLAHGTKWARQNHWTVLIDSSLTDARFAEFFNAAVIGVDYSIGGTVSSERRIVGGVRSDSITGREPADIRITCMDDASGQVKRWFWKHLELASSSDGTVGLPGQYGIRMRIIHSSVLDKNGAAFSWEGWMRPVSLEATLDRRESALEELSLSFTQMDTWA